ncbi:MAG TPA: M50 family metallopeptidase [Candidatus Nanoarchaeia archaeon]|nr:M50 family metallopeptidase [Candidatus Nanoarchaeia archaeon]
MFTFMEIIDAAIMSAAMGYIFMDAFPQHPRRVTSTYFQQFQGFRWPDFWFACAVTAPSIILHEMGHKFVAMAYGLNATFHAAYSWLMLGIGLKLLNTGLIFFIPGYVSIGPIGSSLQMALIALAGPIWHLLLWGGSKLVLNSGKKIPHNAKFFLMLLGHINGFLLIFNLLPIPGFDGFSVYLNLYRAFF